MNTFELRSLPYEKKRRLFLIQLPYRTVIVEPVAEPTTCSMIDGFQLEAASKPILELVGDRVRSVDSLDHGALDANGLFDTGWTVAVAEEVAVRLGLLFASINSLRSEERIHAIVSGIEGQDAKQVGFWLHNINKDRTGNMLKAFRVAMTGET